MAESLDAQTIDITARGDQGVGMFHREVSILIPVDDECRRAFEGRNGFNR